MKRSKKLISILLSLVIIITSVIGINITALATSISQSQAVSWATSKKGKALDYDGQYGAQCVDLIYYYYNYLGVPVQGGNASAYINNTLPSGWTRVYSGFKPGDIAVWKTNHSCNTCNTDSYGHVGIITSADTVGFNAVNQNFNSQMYCTENWFNISSLACAIRPNFSSNSVNITISNQKTYDITTNSAKVAFTTNNTSNASISNFGVLIKKSSSSSWEKDYRENYSTTYANPTTEYVIGSGKEVNYTLQSGTSYSWQPYVISNGKYYYGSVKTFNTAAPAHTHSYSNVINKATLTADGEIVYKCSCGSVAARNTIYKIDSVKLSSTLYTYNGKAKKPSVKVYDRAGNQINSSNYTVQYQTGRTTVGKYAVKVTFKNNYSGTKTLYFKIRPQGTNLVSVTPGSKRFTVKWNKQTTQTTGYQIQYATNSSFTSNVVTLSNSNNNTASTTIKNLKAKKKYYVRIRTYKIVNSTKYYSAWSGYKYVTTKA